MGRARITAIGEALGGGERGTRKKPRSESDSYRRETRHSCSRKAAVCGYNKDVSGCACANTMTMNLVMKPTANIPQIRESVLHVQHLPPADASLSVGLDQSPTYWAVVEGTCGSFPRLIIITIYG